MTKLDFTSRTVAGLAIAVTTMWSAGQLRGCYYDGLRGEEAMLSAGYTAVKYYRVQQRLPESMYELLNSGLLEFLNDGLFVRLRGCSACTPALYEHFRRTQLGAFRIQDVGPSARIAFVTSKYVPEQRQTRVNSLLLPEWVQVLTEAKPESTTLPSQVPS